MGINVHPLDFRSLGAVLVAASVSSAFAFLRESPIPRPEDDTDFIVPVGKIAASPSEVPPLRIPA